MTTDHPTYETAVRNLQRYLRRLSEEGDGNGMFSVPIDGIFDTQTEAAVSEFQRTRRLPVTGRADRVTWDTLFREYEILVRENDTRIYADFFPSAPPNYQTEFGEQSPFISLLQFVLDELRVSYDTLPQFEMSGTFDGDTSLAVKEFQRIHSLPITGRVNLNTWNRLSDAYNRHVRDSQ